VELCKGDCWCFFPSWKKAERGGYELNRERVMHFFLHCILKSCYCLLSVTGKLFLDGLRIYEFYLRRGSIRKNGEFPKWVNGVRGNNKR